MSNQIWMLNSSLPNLFLAKHTFFISISNEISVRKFIIVEDGPLTFWKISIITLKKGINLLVSYGGKEKYLYNCSLKIALVIKIKLP